MAVVLRDPKSKPCAQIGVCYRARVCDGAGLAWFSLARPHPGNGLGGLFWE